MTQKDSHNIGDDDAIKFIAVSIYIEGVCKNPVKMMQKQDPRDKKGWYPGVVHVWNSVATVMVT